ncbi:hypothetical protein [Chryseobacterium sp. ISL-6]|uniref:hypothetical protein n=1 Tax=Chryseobacterium sp. ISL-6 TaxID=2819143 RepID=UPI001BEBCE76|nr:hypothetical protein [Chryseobacterium sp. ISL-6]MBT2620372.1 hypothetical protein [Chryseobacterium sp. ISL-6]
MKKIVFLLLVLLLFNCTKKTELKKKISDNDTINKTEFVKFDFNDKELQNNLSKAILDGDTIAYIRSYKKYTTNGRDKEFLYYAILMAEKNNYKRAYYDISRILALRTDDPLSKKYKFSSFFGTYSFLKSYEMGDDFAKEDIKDFYLEKKIPIPKSSSVYCDH